MAENVLQQTTGEVVIDAFNLLGGNAEGAVSSAKSFSSVNSWTAWQATQAAAVGAAAAAIPVGHLFTLPADVAVLMHKMAWCSWGIGGMMGCQVEGELDLALILGLWSGSITKEDVEMMLVGGVVLGGAVATAVTVTSSPTLAAKIAAITAQFGTTIVAEKLGLATTVAGSLGQVSGLLAQQLMQHFAAKIAAKIAKVAASRAFLGFVPLIGPIAGGTINAIFVNAIADSAKTYYQIKKCG